MRKVQCARYSVPSTMCQVQRVRFNVPLPGTGKVCIVQYARYNVPSKVYRVQCIRHIAKDTVCKELCASFNVQGKLVMNRCKYTV